MKLCVIGNSHVAMLASAAKQVPDVADLTVFAMPKLTAKHIALGEGRIISDSTDLNDWLSRFGTGASVELAGFDAIVIVGLSASLYPAARITQTHIVTGWPKNLQRFQAGLDRGDQTQLNPPITRDSYRATLTAINDNSLAHAIVAELRKTSAIPAFIIAQPFPSEALMQADEYPVIRKIIGRGHGDDLAADLRHAYAQSFGQLTNTTTIAQPADTVVKGCLTNEGYMRGARRLDLNEPQPSNDIMHGNAALGRLYLDDVLNRA